jgi:hypothetical protein
LTPPAIKVYDISVTSPYIGKPDKKKDETDSTKKSREHLAGTPNIGNRPIPGHARFIEKYVKPE